MSVRLIHIIRNIESFLFFIGIAFVLEIISRSGIVSPLYFPPISKDVLTFIDLTISGVLPLEVLKTFARMACGYGLSAIIMIPLGIFMGISNRLYYLLDPLIEFLRPLPPPSIIPVVMLFLGIGDSMKIFVIFFACSFPMIINSTGGARSVHPLLLHTGRSFGLRKIQLIRKVILPSSIPQIMSGLRISLPISLIVAILSEMIGSVDGIGHFILRMQRTFNIPEMYAGIMMLGIIGYLLNKIFLIFDNTLLAWHNGWKQSSN
ncbi:MAG: ABC transporter permease [Desulfobacterales bacterium]